MMHLSSVTLSQHKVSKPSNVDRSKIDREDQNFDVAKKLQNHHNWARRTWPVAEELQGAGPRNWKKNQPHHQFMVQECRRFSAFIEKVLDFSRHERGRKQ